MDETVLGVDDLKPHHERESDSDEAKTRDNFNDVTVVSGDDSKESQKRNASEDQSSSSSSSEDDEVKVEKETSGQSSYSEATRSDETHEPAGSTPETRPSEIPEIAKVKEVVSLPQELNSATTDLIESQMEQDMNEILPLSDEQTRPDTEGLLPKDSDVTTVDRDGIDGQCKESEKNSSSEEQPLVTRPSPVRRTSWMNCCGLFDVLSGGSSR